MRPFLQDKVLKNGPNKSCEIQPLKIETIYGLFKQNTSSQFFKGILQQNLFDSFLNTLSYFQTEILLILTENVYHPGWYR